MTEEQFDALLKRQEADTLDFKSKSYDLSSEDSKADLVKDVICMANTPRDRDSFIVLGVKKYPDGTCDLLGLSNSLDDADLQAQFADRVYPIPRFSYSSVLHSGKQFGVICIPAEKIGPSVPTRDFLNLRQWQVYFRRHSRNSVATPSDVLQILEWFGARFIPRAVFEDAVPAWQRFIESVRNFDLGFHYVLLVSPALPVHPEKLAAIGTIPLAAVLDFDPDSDMNGVLAACKALLEKRRSLHMLTLRESLTLNINAATYWYFVRGLTGRPETTRTSKWIDWQRADGAALNDQLRRLASACAPNPVVFVVLWAEPTLTRFLQSTLEGIIGTFSETADIVIVTRNLLELDPLAQELGATIIDMSIDHLCSGLETIFRHGGDDGNGPRLPSSSGTPLPIPLEDLRWFQEELEVVHFDEGLSAPADREIGREFLKGNEISWYDLGLHYDVDRDVSERLQKQLDIELNGRRTSRVSMYHAPGAGGSTTGRRMLWNFHRRVPCAILRRTKPRQTAERLIKLIAITGSAALILVDGAEVSSREMDELYDLLKSQQAPVVILQVLRRFEPQKEGLRTFYLKAELSNEEAGRFAHLFARENPLRQPQIQKLAMSADPRLRTAFYFGLHTFREDFRGLGPFVSQYLQLLNDVQKKLIGFIAISHHYAQKLFPAQAFARLLGMPENSKIDLARTLNAAAALLIRGEGGLWRTSHELIATEILQQLLWPSAQDRRLWKQNLSNWALEFAQLCRGEGAIVSNEMVEIVRRAFFFRDNTDLLGTERSGAQQFSQLIDDIPSREGRLETLRQATNLFSDEAHFWAHLGRFYALQMKDYVQAGLCIDRAIELNSGDSVLHHMRGMAYRYELYQLIGEGKPLDNALVIAKNASQSFSQARELNPDDDHGYISEVQMLAKLIGYAAGGQSEGSIAYLANTTVDPFLRDSLERAEDLLETVRRHREGEGESPYEADCRAQLDVIYGRHDRALQVWDALLSRQDVYAPPVRRQIVWTYLARRRRNWDQLQSKEADRIVSLLEDNLVQEPESQSNMRLWVQAVRRSSYPPSLNAIIEKVANWRARFASLESAYYLYVLYALQAIEGVPLAYESAMRFLEESKTMARFRRDRTKSYEWFGKGTGVRRLVHHSQLGEWDTTRDFWQHIAPLERTDGRIIKVETLGVGELELRSGLKAFFVPVKGGFTSKHLNHPVTLYLGFSFDGLRAWEVREAKAAN